MLINEGKEEKKKGTGGMVIADTIIPVPEGS